MDNLSINNLAFERNNECLFDEITENLVSGDILQIRGVNGSGKSTFLRIMAGFLTPTTGSVLWNEKNILKYDDYSREIIYLGHQNGTNPYLTVYENLRLNFALANQKITHDFLLQLLRASHLYPLKDTKAMHLSAGQNRRLALSRLQISHTRLWILDEPTTALDQSGEAWLADLLNQHLVRGGIAIIATHHDLNIARPIKTLHLEKAHV